MKITFLGTSHGIPSETRFCSSTLLETGGKSYLIDCGAPVADLMIRREISFSSLCAVFLTHMHGDHTFGLTSLLSLSNWYFQDTNYDVFMPDETGIDVFRQMILLSDETLNEERIRLKKTEPGIFYTDDRITARAVLTRHINNGNRPSYAYIVDAEGKRVVFTGDLHQGDAADFPNIAIEEKSDAVICEMAHFAPEIILPIVEKCPTKQVIFNHVWYDYEKSMAAIRSANGRMSFPVCAAEDGDVIEI